MDRHLVSDVPVGLFLSGGIDSSALVALARERGITPRTFVVTFPGLEADEGRFAAAVAHSCGADHHEIPLTEIELLAELPRALASVDHPSGDGINTYVVSQAVRRAGVKVALSGLGGDELFGGYPSFRRLRRLAAVAPVWRRSPAALRGMAARTIRAVGGGSIAADKTAAVLERDGSVPRTFPILRGMFTPEGRRDLLDERVWALRSDADPYETLLHEAAARAPRADTMALTSYAEARTYMHDVLLRDTDQMSMAHGLEVRVPLLDDRLVSYVMGLPEEIKTAGRTAKPLLVESLGAALPETCVTRPKQGFVLPFDRWMRSELRPFCEHHLGRAGLSGRGVVRAPAVDALWRAFLDRHHRTNWARPWTLVALNAWIEQNRLCL
jgi:asparagine synthase (glutamine-hydrolysing)